MDRVVLITALCVLGTPAALALALLVTYAALFLIHEVRFAL